MSDEKRSAVEEAVEAMKDAAFGIENMKEIHAPNRYAACAERLRTAADRLQREGAPVTQGEPSREALVDALRHAYYGDHKDAFLGVHDLSAGCEGCVDANRILARCEREARGDKEPPQ